MFLKNKNIIFKIRRSKVTDYAALTLENSVGSKYYPTEKQLTIYIYKLILNTLGLA